MMTLLVVISLPGETAVEKPAERATDQCPHGYPENKHILSPFTEVYGLGEGDG